MLQLILGRAGSGKTEYLNNLAKNAANEGKKIFYIVPEQYSFESEKALYNILGSKASAQVKVVSFSSLSHLIFRHLGFPKGNELSKAEKQLSMAVAVEELKTRLDIYAGYALNGTFISSMVDTIEDFKSAGITAEILKNSLGNCEDDILARKLSDINLIYTTYQNVMDKNGCDPKDNISVATEKVTSSSLFAKSIIFIDSFMMFTTSEYELIAAMARQCDKLYVSICTPSLHDDSEGLGSFSAPTLTASKLIRIAKNEMIAVNTPIVLEKNYRHKKTDISHFEEHYLIDDAPDEKKSENIFISSYIDPYAEITAVAAKVKELICEEKYRYKDIAVIARDFTRYENAINRVFRRYELPYFTDRSGDLFSSPIVMFIQSVLEAAEKSTQLDSMLKIAKSPMLEIDALSFSRLENYAYVWSLKGSDFANKFNNYPDGITNKAQNNNEEILNEINLVREKVYNIVLKVKEGTKNATAKKFAAVVYELLTSVNIKKVLTDISNYLPTDKQVTFLKEQNSVWEEVIYILDIMAEILGEYSFSLPRLTELFNICLTTTEYGKLPQTQDQVIIGTADRIRLGEIKAVFVIGCIEGEFPATPQERGILTNKERQKIVEMGVDLTAPVDEIAKYENYYSYYAITRASEKLYISYPQNDASGNALEPSVIIAEAVKLFGALSQKYDVQTKINLIWNKETGLDVLTEMQSDDDKLKPLGSWLCENLYPETFAELSRRSKKAYNHKIEDDTLIHQLYGTTLRLSPSKIDNFFNCRFKYYLTNTLKINPRRRVELSPIEVGSLIHYVLEKMVKTHGNQLNTLTESNIKSEVSTLVKEYLSSSIKDLDILSARLKYLFSKIEKDITLIVLRLAEELVQSDFIPIAFEEKIGYGQNYQPLKIALDNDAEITVSGVVDRIDMYERDGSKYIRVIDYKSGSKKFELSDILYGLNMQMLIYLFAICDDDFIKGSTKPAGILYMPAKNTLISVDADMSDEAIWSKKRETMKMSGIVLAEQDIIYGMEKGGEGLFIPAKIKDGEIEKKSSVATLAELGMLYKAVSNNLIKLGGKIYEGDVAALPISGGGYNPCTYCDFSVVCGNESGKEVVEIAKLDRLEIFKEMGDECGS